MGINSFNTNPEMIKMKNVCIERNGDCIQNKICAYNYICQTLTVKPKDKHEICSTYDRTAT